MTNISEEELIEHFIDLVFEEKENKFLLCIDLLKNNKIPIKKDKLFDYLKKHNYTDLIEKLNKYMALL